MYTCIHRVYMWQVEPRLYWRVKLNGKWTWRTANIVDDVDYAIKGCLVVEYIEPEVNEGE